jgi:hypothetical protein
MIATAHPDLAAITSASSQPWRRTPLGRPPDHPSPHGFDQTLAANAHPTTRRASARSWLDAIKRHASSDSTTSAGVTFVAQRP